MGAASLDLVERECKTDRDGALAWLEGQGLLTGTGRLGSRTNAQPQAQAEAHPAYGPQSKPTRWHKGGATGSWPAPYPPTPNNPARRWLTRRNLWRAGSCGPRHDALATTMGTA